MILTILNSICLIALGLAGFIGWGKMEAEGNPAEMLMPVFFGGTVWHTYTTMGCRVARAVP